MKRKPALKGLWYPDDPSELDKLLDLRKLDNCYRNGVLPHAGLFYSAPIISEFFSSLAEDIESVIILSPSHYFRLETDAVYSFPYSQAETPYGDIECFELPIPYIKSQSAADREHGLEMFLPFAGKKKLRVSFGVISFLSSPAAARQIAEKLLPRLDGQTAVIASSDFTHYGRRFGWKPYEDDPIHRTADHDLRAASLMRDGDISSLYKEFIGSTICGLAPSMIVSSLSAKQGLKGELGPHHTSSDITGNEEDFVSYCSVFWR